MQYIDFKLQIYACVPARPFIYRSAMSELYMSGLCVKWIEISKEDINYLTSLTHPYNSINDSCLTAYVTNFTISQTWMAILTA